MPDNPYMHPDLADLSETQGQPPEPKLWAGKYKNEDELERGYTNLFSEGQKLVGRINELEAQLNARQSVDPYGDRVAERTSPADRSAGRQDPYEVLETAGVPVKEFREAILREVRQGVQQEIQPLFQGAQARQMVSQDYPEFSQFEGELAQFVESNPALKQRYTRAYQTDPEVALKWVYGEFQKTRSTPMNPNNSAAGDVQMAARLDATLPRAASQPRGQQTANPAEEYRQVYEQALKSGNWSDVLAWKLRGTIPDLHYQGLQG